MERYETDEQSFNSSMLLDRLILCEDLGADRHLEFGLMATSLLSIILIIAISILFHKYSRLKKRTEGLHIKVSTNTASKPTVIETRFDAGMLEDPYDEIEEPDDGTTGPSRPLPKVSKKNRTPTSQDQISRHSFYVYEVVDQGM